ncbi:molecular chaperone DnaK [Pseudochryseolinea flava]|uniref:Molecular chaperone DnaK n=1 Tax=Pseudochryseolinea flava TaxID=2059302 RepID=A0A364Y877_9BACT|nr:molecular chaperone DnaK [Pseudochryseolinea flava]
MAKSKKPTPKAAKKPASKAKPAAKVKKAAPAKAKKAAPKKAAPAKKAAPKKVTKKPVAVKKEVVAKKVAPKKVEKVEKIVSKKAEKTVTPPVEKATPPVTPKAAPPQLTIFPVPNQRPIAHKPAKASSTEDRTRYSDEELKEFESLINRKLDKAREEYKILKDTLNRNNDEGTDATSGGNTKVLEDGAETAEKENLSQLAARQQKYITNLENALIRIKNGTYGICSVTGKLIPKERLIAVPHTTQSIEAKMMQQD